MPEGRGLTHQRSKGNAMGIQWHRCGCCSIMNRRSRWQFNTILNSSAKSLRASLVARATPAAATRPRPSRGVARIPAQSSFVDRLMSPIHSRPFYQRDAQLLGSHVGLSAAGAHAATAHDNDVERCVVLEALDLCCSARDALEAAGGVMEPAHRLVRRRMVRPDRLSLRSAAPVGCSAAPAVRLLRLMSWFMRCTSTP